MKRSEIRKIRCYAEPVNGNWQAFCVDLNLAVQGETFPQVRSKLDAMVQSYIELANKQTDPRRQRDMLYRPAPVSIVARYWLVWAAGTCRRLLHTHRARFKAIAFATDYRPAHC